MEVSPINVPVPADVQGPYGMKMCLSPDGKEMAVTGGIAGHVTLWNPGKLIFAGTLKPDGQRLFSEFEKRIYAAPSPPELPDYTILSDDGRMRVILTMAISPSKARQLAYVSRETTFALPGDLGHAVTHEDQLKLFRFFKSKRPEGLQEVLYIVPLSGGATEAVATLRRDIKSDELYRKLGAASLCWIDDSNAFAYCDGKSIMRISRKGETKILHQFAEDHHAASSLVMDPGGTISFVDFFYVNSEDGRSADKPPRGELVTIDESGRVVEQKEWPNFTFGTFLPHEWIGPALLGRKKWAYLDTSSEEARGRLCVGSRSDPSFLRTYIMEAKTQDVPLSFTLFAFSPDETEIWLSENLDFYKAPDLNTYSPSAPFASLKKVVLR